jgi:hypothetical protein
MSPEFSPLYTARFFFWTASTSLQKSQSGLLRSVLRDVLELKFDPSSLSQAMVSTLRREALAFSQ